MPEKYEAMRDSFKSEGMSEAAAKTKAAKIYNSQRSVGQKPVTPHYNKQESAEGCFPVHENMEAQIKKAN